MGTNRVTKATRLSLAEAKEIVKQKGIKSIVEFEERRKTDPELQQVPSHPNRTYKEEGWISWPDFLGTNRVTKATRLSLAEAKEIVKQKGIKSIVEFEERRKTDQELQQVPSNPHRAYKEEGWISWYDFLGTNRVWLTLGKAKEIVRQKGIKSGREFRERRKTDPELRQIPSNPNIAYKEEGWISWYDFFGTNS